MWASRDTMKHHFRIHHHVLRLCHPDDTHLAGTDNTALDTSNRTALAVVGRPLQWMSTVQGWRIEVLKYPQLTNVGAWRGGRDGVPCYGGYYTQDEACSLCHALQPPDQRCLSSFR